MATYIVYVVLLFCLKFAFVAADSDHGQVALGYTEEQFDKEVPEIKHFVMFYAPWCGHCKRLAPNWDELAKVYNIDSDEKKIVIAKVDCTEETNLCAKHEVTGYPTLKLFYQSPTDFVRYKGGRDLDALKKFVEEQFVQAEDSDPQPPEPLKGLYELTQETFNEHISHGQHFIKFYAPWCGHCKRLAPTWEDLARGFQYTEGVSIAKIDCTTSGSLCETFSVRGYPTLLWIKDGRKVDQYQGGRTLDELKNYVSRMMEMDDSIKERTDEMIVEGSEDPEVQVVELSESDFEDKISKGFVFVKFFAPWCGHCKRLAPVWEELSLKFAEEEDVTIAKVDCTQHGTVCKEHKVRGYPTLILFNNGVKISDYNGARDLKSLLNFVEEYKKRKDEL